MTMEKVESKISNDGFIQEVIFTNDSHKPSWKTYGAGFATLRFQTHSMRKYLSVSASEFDRSTDRERRVHITLNEKEASELMKQLTAFMATSEATKLL
jgi:hypothetical protein